MNEVSLKPVIEELESLFSKFNSRFFADKLEKPVITVSPDHTRGAYGWCTGWKAWKAGEDEGHYEINLCAEYLNRPFEETCGTLIHGNQKAVPISPFGSVERCGPLMRRISQIGKFTRPFAMKFLCRCITPV